MGGPAASSLEDRVAALRVAPGTAALVWLGQGGYVLKSPAGVVVMLDPYLSDYAEHIWGMRRAVPPPVDHTRVAPDLLLVTHWHEDHLDRPVVQHYASDPRVTLAGPSSCVVRAAAWGWPADRLVTLDTGGAHAVDDVTVTATFARHEVPIAPAFDAVGFLMDVAGVRVWDVGDTEYDARLRPMREANVDVMLVPINGVGGNLDVSEAALLAWQVRPRIAVPMHYDMWAPETFGPGATLDPTVFLDTLARLDGPTEARILQRGDVNTFGK